MSDFIYTKAEFANKMKWEGGLLGVISYFGRRMPTIKGVAKGNMMLLKQKWAILSDAYDALENDLEKLLPASE